jgi:hypothetical protein
VQSKCDETKADAQDDDYQIFVGAPHRNQPFDKGGYCGKYCVDQSAKNAY